MRKALFVFIALALSVQASRFHFSDFCQITAIALNGDSEKHQKSIRVVPALNDRTGSAIYSDPLDLSKGFQTSFSFKVSEKSGGGADGMTFIISTETSLHATVLGRGSSGLGFAGIPGSIAILIDMYKNEDIGDKTERELAIHSKGILPNTQTKDAELARISEEDLPNYKDGKVHKVFITGSINNEGKLVLIAQIGDGASAKLTYTFTKKMTQELRNLTSAYIGFTGSTGARYLNIDIEEWEFTSANDKTCIEGFVGESCLPDHNLASSICPGLNSCHVCTSGVTCCAWHERDSKCYSGTNAPDGTSFGGCQSHPHLDGKTSGGGSGWAVMFILALIGCAGIWVYWSNRYSNLERGAAQLGDMGQEYQKL